MIYSRKKRLTVLLWVLITSIVFSLKIEAVEKITTFRGENLNDQFGISMHSAGDFNGDGYLDLVIGANLEDSGGDAAGRCYIYLGGMAPDSVPALTFTGSQGDRFGTRVAGGGDINNDGYDDIAVYARGESGLPGYVYIFFGGSSLDGVPDAVLGGVDPDDRFGQGLSLESDINADGCNDLVVGAPDADSSGAVYLYFGSDPFDQTADMIIHGENSGDMFGSMVAAGGDVNGDGYDDFMAGAPRNDDSAVWAGKTYLYLGGAALDTIPDLSMTGVATGDGFGTAGRFIGDLNGDSIDEMIISAPYFNNIYGDDVGIIYLFLGASTPDGINDGLITGELYYEQLGYSLSSTDVDGDGIDDIIAGAPGYGGPGVQFGKVYLYRGEYPLPATPLFSHQPTDTTGGLGISVAGLGRFTMHQGDGGSFAAGGWNIEGKGAANLYGEPIVVTDIDPVEEIKESMVDVYPNPTRSSLSIRCHLAERSEVSMVLYDVAGRKIDEIAGGVYGKGMMVQDWHPGIGDKKLSRGIYFVAVKIGERTFTRKVIVMR